MISELEGRAQVGYQDGLVRIEHHARACLVEQFGPLEMSVRIAEWGYDPKKIWDIRADGTVEIAGKEFELRFFAAGKPADLNQERGLVKKVEMRTKRRFFRKRHIYEPGKLAIELKR